MAERIDFYSLEPLDIVEYAESCFDTTRRSYDTATASELAKVANSRYYEAIENGQIDVAYRFLEASVAITKMAFLRLGQS